MKAFRRVAWAFGLAIALLIGQQVAALHDLKHATEQLTQKDGKPVSTTCDQCFACAELSGAVGATLLQVPADCAPHVLVAATPAQDALSAPLLAFRSRAPPTLL